MLNNTKVSKHQAFEKSDIIPAPGVYRFFKQFLKSNKFRKNSKTLERKSWKFEEKCRKEEIFCVEFEFEEYQNLSWCQSKFLQRL